MLAMRADAEGRMTRGENPVGNTGMARAREGAGVGRCQHAGLNVLGAPILGSNIQPWILRAPAFENSTGLFSEVYSGH